LRRVWCIYTRKDIIKNKKTIKMDKKSKELAISMLKETTSYKYKRVDYKEFENEKK